MLISISLNDTNILPISMIDNSLNNINNVETTIVRSTNLIYENTDSITDNTITFFTFDMKYEIR